MKIIVSLLFLTCISTLNAQSPANEIPLYEGIKKNSAQIANDQTFVANAIKATGSRQSALDQIVAAGWQAISKADAPLAIKRFNQGFLLAPQDYRIYWGLGIASGMRNDFQRSHYLFEKGYTLNQQDERFLSDYGFSIQQLALFLAQTKNVDPRPQLLAAKKIFERAIALKPEQALPHARIAAIYFYQQDCKNSLRETSIAQKLGGEGLDPRFLNDLKVACPI